MIVPFLILLCIKNHAYSDYLDFFCCWIIVLLGFCLIDWFVVVVGFAVLFGVGLRMMIYCELICAFVQFSFQPGFLNINVKSDTRIGQSCSNLLFNEN